MPTGAGVLSLFGRLVDTVYILVKILYHGPESNMWIYVGLVLKPSTKALPTLWQRHNGFKISCVMKVTIVYFDNVSAIYLSTNLVQHQRMKHIKTVIHFVWDKVATRQIRVLQLPSGLQYVDIFI